MFIREEVNAYPGSGWRLWYLKSFELQHFRDILKDPERSACKLLGMIYFFLKQKIDFSLPFPVSLCLFYDKGC